MFNKIGFGEVLLIAIVALVIFGPSKLPEMGRSVGQAIREFKKATQSLTDEVTKVATEEIRDAAAKVEPAKAEPTEPAERPVEAEAPSEAQPEAQPETKTEA